MSETERSPQQGPDDHDGRVPDPADAGHPQPARARFRPELESRELVTGRKPGERYIRITRPGGGLRRVGAGRLEATERAFRARTPLGRFSATLRRVVFGQPLASARLAHERLSKVRALAVFSSDALSSSAYATEEMLRVLVLAGAAALSLTLPVAASIVVLLAIVATSYAQVIKAYPQGGGSYVVTKDNLGTWPSLVAGAALMIDYTLTVAVSVSAGVAAITSAFPEWHPYAVEFALGFIALIMLINLRGARESGAVFAVPTYLFIGMALAMIALGGLRLLVEGPVPAEARAAHLEAIEPLALFLVLKAFASGNAALTGTEAISDGVPAFKEPEARNARITLAWMAAILGTLFLGISFLTVQFAILPAEETVVSQLGRLAFGGGTPPYYVFQAATMLILVLAANTSFSGFPILSYFLARDHFLPHQFQFRGDRLAFSTGIVVLAIVAGAVIATFRADTHALIPLYAVGVFTAFTLSQASMVVRWWRKREPGWRYGLPINALGAASTGLVTVVVAVTKFEHGAWMVIALLPVLVLTMRAINAHYVNVADQLTSAGISGPLPEVQDPPVVVPVPGIDRAIHRTVAVARGLSKNVTAVHVTDDGEAGERVRQRWQSEVPDVPLVVLESPYRSLVGPLLRYIDELQQQDPSKPVQVVLSEFVPRHLWEYPLHNQTALRLKLALFFRPNTVVTDVPYHLER